MSVQNLQILILGTIRTCVSRYIPPETKLLKFCRPNIAKIVILVSDKIVVFVFGVRFTFLFHSKIGKLKNKIVTTYSNECNILYLPIHQVR